jgi:hypothetical protein
MSYYRRNYRTSKPVVRNIAVKFAAPCACCGVTIKAGELATYYPVGTIASVTVAKICHIGGLEGNSHHCAANLRAAFVKAEDTQLASYVAEGLGEW